MWRGARIFEWGVSLMVLVCVWMHVHPDTNGEGVERNIYALYTQDIHVFHCITIIIFNFFHSSLPFHGSIVFTGLMTDSRKITWLMTDSRKDHRAYDRL